MNTKLKGKQCIWKNNCVMDRGGESKGSASCGNRQAKLDYSWVFLFGGQQAV